MLKEKVDVNMAWYFFLLIISTFLIIMFPISLTENGRLRKENEKLEERIKEQSMLIEYLEVEMK